MTIETEIEDAQSIRDVGAGCKRKESQSSSSLGKKPRLLPHVGSKVATIRAKVRSGLPARQDSTANNLDI